MDTATTCARHPDTETRLSCSNCGTPICPRCSVPTPVGQKCPDCARLPKSARRQAKPEHYVKGAGLGVVAAVGVAFALSFAFRQIGFTWILSGLGGYAIARAVQAGSAGSVAPALRRGAVVLAVAAVVGAWLIAGLAAGRLLDEPIRVIGYLAGGFGAYVAYNR